MSSRTEKHIPPSNAGKLIGLISDEDTVVGFLLGGIGEITLVRPKIKEPNYMIVTRFTQRNEIEECFHKFTRRADMDIILINQTIADKIRPLINAQTAVLPTILEIPSKDFPYDANKDSILRRARGLFNPEDLSMTQDTLM